MLKIIFTSLLLFFLFIPRVLFAYNMEQSIYDLRSKGDEDKKKYFVEKIYDAICQFTNDNEYLFSPISGAAVGMGVCGPLCAVGGGVVGTLDEIFLHSRYTDKRYLTWGIFGASVGNIINPVSTISAILGAVVGILTPTGMLGEYKKVVVPVAFIMSGNSVGGIEKGISLGVANVFDELLLSRGITEKHYLTFGTTGANLVGWLVSCINPLMTYPMGAVLGLVAVVYEDRIVSDFISPLKTANFLHETHEKFIPKKELENHVEQHILTTLGNQFLFQFLNLKVLNSQGILNHNFEHLNDATGQAWNNFNNEIINYAILLLPYIIEKIFSQNIDYYFNRRIHIKLENEIREKLFFGETALRLSHDQNNTVLIDNLKDDIYVAVHSGGQLLTSAASTFVEGMYGVGMIAIHSPVNLAYSSLCNEAKTLIADYLATQKNFYSSQIIVLDSKFMTTFKHDAENIRTITELDGVNATKEKLLQLSTELRDLENIQRFWTTINNFWWTIAEYTDFLLNYFLIVKGVHYQTIPFDQKRNVLSANMKISKLFSWNADHAYHTLRVKQSLKRIGVLEGKMIMPQKTRDLDQINRLVIEGDKLIFQELEVGVGDMVLVTADNFELDMGKVYAVTGKTGCGKTSLLSKIKGIKENGIYGKGNIYYPKIKGGFPKIVMISQQEYFPLNSTLHEIIVYPNKPSDDLSLHNEERERISFLLREIGIYAFNAKYRAFDIENVSGSVAYNNSVGICEVNEEGSDDEYCFSDLEDHLDLDSKKNWYTRLSGGEKKKIMIVSSILKEPDILILDEVFNELDPSSVKIVQQLLKTYLPYTLILSVDHHARDNNYNSFYDGELHIADRSLIEL